MVGKLVNLLAFNSDRFPNKVITYKLLMFLPTYYIRLG